MELLTDDGIITSNPFFSNNNKQQDIICTKITNAWQNGDSHHAQGFVWETKVLQHKIF